VVVLRKGKIEDLELRIIIFSVVMLIRILSQWDTSQNGRLKR